MPPKFNIQTADRDGLVERVTQLTSALVKQKDTIGKLKAAEETLLAENEKLQRQIRLLSEEGEMGRQLRGELQNEVARLQRSLDLLSAEMQMMQQHGSGTSKQENGEKNMLNLDETLVNKPGTVQRSGSVQDVADVSQNSQTKMLKTEVLSLLVPMDAANTFLSKVSAQFRKEVKDANAITDTSAAASDDGRTSVSDSFTDQGLSGTPVKIDSRCSSDANLVEISVSENQSNVGADQNENPSAIAAEAAAVAGEQVDQLLKNSETARLRAEERVEATLAAYVQAKKFAEDLQQTIDTKDKEIDSLRKVLQRKADVDTNEMRRREQDVARISALEAQISSQEAAVKTAQEKMALLMKENSHLQSSLKNAQSSGHERMATALAAARRLEEREVALRKELEGSKAANETLKGQLQAVEEEKERVLQQDKLIIKRLQAENRCRVSELEARIAGLEQALARHPCTTTLATQGFLGSATTSSHHPQELLAESERNGHVGEGAGQSAEVDTGAALLATRALDLVMPVGADMSLQVESNGGGAGRSGARGVKEEELIRRCLRAIEDLIEVLMLRPQVSKRMERDLQQLEWDLAAAGHLDALERRVDALCALTQIASEYLQELPWEEGGSSRRGLDGENQAAVSGACARCFSSVWSCVASVCVCLPLDMWFGHPRADAGGAYTRVRAVADYEDASGL